MTKQNSSANRSRYCAGSCFLGPKMVAFSCGETFHRKKKSPFLEYCFFQPEGDSSTSPMEMLCTFDWTMVPGERFVSFGDGSLSFPASFHSISKTGGVVHV